MALSLIIGLLRDANRRAALDCHLAVEHSVEAAAWAPQSPTQGLA